MGEQVYCNKCLASFEAKLEEKKLGKGIDEIYFICPHCAEYHVASITDAECRRRQREIKRLYEGITAEIGSKEYEKSMKFVEQKKLELEPLMERVKNSNE